MEEHDGSDNNIRQYTYGNYLDEVWTLDNRAGGITVAQLNDGSGAQRLFYHQNTLYSVFALTDETGAIQETYQYDAYGRQSVDTSSGTDATWFTSDDTWTVGGNSALGNPYAYTGQRFDAESGNSYYKNRYYSSGTGRFLSRDPIGYKGGLDLYEYTSDQPTNTRDLLGLKPSFSECMKKCTDAIGTNKNVDPGTCVIECTLESSGVYDTEPISHSAITQSEYNSCYDKWEKNWNNENSQLGPMPPKWIVDHCGDKFSKSTSTSTSTGSTTGTSSSSCPAPDCNCDTSGTWSYAGTHTEAPIASTGAGNTGGYELGCDCVRTCTRSNGTVKKCANARAWSGQDGKSYGGPTISSAVAGNDCPALCKELDAKGKQSGK